MNFTKELREEQQRLKNEFTNEELKLLSDAVLSAISNNNKAVSYITSGEAVGEIRRANSRLAEINSKICAMMKD